MGWETFRTRKAAKARIETMRGWGANPIKVYIPDDPNSDKDGYVWVIQCGSPVGGGYLHTDGYIR